MKMSCNGCRVLRKGCTENCTLRNCIQWITSPQSQANATLFLSKFYGRAGLLHLLNSGPAHLRPDIFKSLLYEACGRIINPISGSAGLMSSDDWPRCQAAVDAVLRGAPLMRQVISDNNGNHEDDEVQEECPVQPFQGCDIRHVSKEAADSLRQIRARNRFKRSKARADSLPPEYWIEPEAKFTITGWGASSSDEAEKNSGGRDRKPYRALSHDSASVETAEPSLVMELEPEASPSSDLGLDLTLGLDPVRRSFSGFS